MFYLTTHSTHFNYGYMMSDDMVKDLREKSMTKLNISTQQGIPVYYLLCRNYLIFFV